MPPPGQDWIRPKDTTVDTQRRNGRLKHEGPEAPFRTPGLRQDDRRPKTTRVCCLDANVYSAVNTACQSLLATAVVAPVPQVWMTNTFPPAPNCT